MFRHEGECSQGSSESKGSRIPHENLSRICIKPEESQARADQPPAENGKFTAPSDEGELKVMGELVVPLHISIQQ